MAKSTDIPTSCQHCKAPVGVLPDTFLCGRTTSEEPNVLFPTCDYIKGLQYNVDRYGKRMWELHEAVNYVSREHEDSLTAIQIVADGLEFRAEALSDEETKDLQRLRRASSRFRNLIDALLEV